MKDPKPIRCLLVDDEMPALDELSFLLSDIGGADIVGTALSASQALEKIDALQPEAVFQDIHMPGASGFNVLQQALARPEPPLFVFATAFDQYAIRAFEENAVDYLLKPVSRERLAKCLERLRCLLRQQCAAPVIQPGLAALLQGMGLAPGLVRISVEDGGRVLLLEHANVVLIRTEDRRMMVHTRDKRYVHHGPGSLDRLEEKLAPLSFFRANRAELVNVAQIRDFAPWFNGKYLLRMRDRAATEITVSKSRVRAFRDQLDLA
jgi:two-component system LytT family response regulator/two-component system response regulator LytT